MVMFTPPPSPTPAHQTVRDDHATDKDHHEGSAVIINSATPADFHRKRMIARKIKWTVLLVPIVLVFIAASSRFVAHPIMFDFLSSSSSSSPQSKWHAWSPTSVWRLHRRHTYPRADQSPSAQTSASKTIAVSTEPPSTTEAAATSMSTTQSPPTVPSSPPTLPTPFPQPLDASLQNNFSSVSCYNFFLNMTNTVPFRACRPFSLLQQSSEAFIQAQSNLSLMNDIVWGTCNTQPGVAQCTANMAWFASTLQSSCEADLNAQNSLAVSTLMALQAYPLMYDTGCLVDPTTSAYCYISAVANSNPSDLYFYQLPLGIALPNGTTLTCSGCTKSLLGLYESALGNGAELIDLSGLRQTYPPAAALASSQCGQGYAISSVVTGAAIGLHVMGSRLSSSGRLLGSVALFALGWSLFL